MAFIHLLLLFMSLTRPIGHFDFIIQMIIEMKSELINTNGSGQRTYAIIMDTGDETMQCLTEFAQQQSLNACQFTAIGAFSSALLGYFDFSKKEYQKIEVDEQVEVLVLAGDISFDKGNQKVHAHVVLGRSDGSTRGGHLMKGYVRPTLEVMLTESPAHLHRKHDEVSGLALIDIKG
jgi:predicted DNA-binding protein with PD1-like motif